MHFILQIYIILRLTNYILIIEQNIIQHHSYSTLRLCCIAHDVCLHHPCQHHHPKFLKLIPPPYTIRNPAGG